MFKKLVSVTVAITIIISLVASSVMNISVSALNASDQRTEVIEEANSHIDYRAGKYNRNKFLGWAYNSKLADGPWCAAFAAYCYYMAGLDAEQYGGKKAQTSCPDWVSDLGNYFHKRSSGYVPQKGDLIFFDNNKNGTADHVGIVTSCDDSYVYTIEGNISKKNGAGKVGTKSYSLTAKNIFGYGEVQFESSFIKGDINGDGKISITDVVKLSQWVNNPQGVIDINVYDVTENGRVDDGDAEALNLYLVGLLDDMTGYTK